MSRLVSKLPALLLVSVMTAGMAALVPARRSEAADLIIKNDDVHKRWDLAIMGQALWWGGVGGTLRLGIPVAPKGFIPGINDQVKIELGFSFQHWWMRHNYCDPHWEWCTGGYDFHRFAFPVRLRWDFYILPVLTVYATVGVEFGFIPDHDIWDDRVYYYGLITFAGSAGVLVNFHERVSLRAEFAHSGFNLGIEFKL